MGRSAAATREATTGGDQEDELHAADPVLSERWWKFDGSKEEAIRQQFDMSGTRYFQILNDLIDRPEALAADPLLVKRLRRMRSSRQKARAARNLGMRLD